MRIYIKYILTLEKYYNLTANRYSKRIYIFINISLALFSGSLYYFSLKSVLLGKNEVGLVLCCAALLLVVFAEIMNIISKNSFTSIFSLNIIDIFPMSKFRYFANLFFSNCLHSRSCYYLIFFFITITFAVNVNSYFMLQAIIFYALLFSVFTAFFTLIDFGYAVLTKLFGEKAKYSSVLILILMTVSVSYLEAFDFSNEKIFKIFIDLSDFLLNK